MNVTQMREPGLEPKSNTIIDTMLGAITER